MTNDVLMDASALQDFLKWDFPQVAHMFLVEEVAPMSLRLRMLSAEEHLRPGGTISGPAMFALADVGVYLAVLAMVGPKALAVTTNCSIDFMRKPRAGRDLLANIRLLKLGKSLAVGDALLHSTGMDDPVARASLTYSLPDDI